MIDGRTEGLDPVFFATLGVLQQRCGFILVVTSGLRAADHNAAVGGVRDSAHLPDESGNGHAADIGCATSWERFKIVKEAVEMGIKRIGIGKTFVHLDDSAHLPQCVMWTYYNKEEANG